jgi:adenosylcobinamide-phosphate synthase
VSLTVVGFQSALTAALAIALDLLLGEPPAALHPVVWVGKLISWLERQAPQGERSRLVYGAAMVAATITPVALATWVVERVLRRRGAPGAAPLGLCLKPAFAIRMLLGAARQVGDALANDDLEAARCGLRSLVSRDTSALPAPLLAAAAIESVAENLSDSVVAPLFYYGLWGLPGAYAYRAINTLDAMVGYRTPRYEWLGKAAARLDDALNLIPARLTGLLLVLAAPFARGVRGAAWRAMRRDHALTASPNAGWPMSAAAGALGLTLEKVGQYRLNPEGRPTEAGDVARAVTLARAGLALGAPLLWLLLWVRRRYYSCAGSDGSRRDIVHVA